MQLKVTEFKRTMIAAISGSLDTRELCICCNNDESMIYTKPEGRWN
jgi:hypothetical protein